MKARPLIPPKPPSSRGSTRQAKNSLSVGKQMSASPGDSLNIGGIGMGMGTEKVERFNEISMPA